MPSIDSGRYFMSIFLPIKTEPLVAKHIMQLSPTQSIRDTLSVWATAQQGVASQESGRNSPFSLNIRNHFVRLFVINDVLYNGRESGDTLINLIKGKFGFSGTHPLIPQKVDQLSSPYLAIIAEIDAPEGKESELDTYLEELWDDIPSHLSIVLQHCVGFDGSFSNAEFCAYMRSGLVETTMPFNDYWQEAPPLVSIFSTWWRAGMVYCVVSGIALACMKSWFWLPLGLVAAVVVLIVGLMVYGSKGYPMAPDSDLKSVLKALFLQEKYINFAIANQGADADDLHREFRRFLDDFQPSNLDDPTQAPGVIGVGGANQ